MAGTLTAETILRDLIAMWRSVGSTESEDAVLRACSMTLVVAAREREDPAALAGTLAPVLREHPSRTIILMPGADGTPLDASVSAQCWMPFGRRQHICSEQIEITLGWDAAAAVAPVLRGLLAPDLPVVMWIEDPAFAATLSQTGILDLADKVIVDTTALPSATDALALVSTLRRERRLAGDLAWTRLTRLRETVARAFETHGGLQRCPAMQRLVIAHSGGSPAVGDYYMAAWLAGALGWEGGAASRQRIRFAGGQPENPAGVAGVRLEGGGFDLSLQGGEGACAELDVCGAGNSAMLPERTLDELLREELSILETDGVFEDTLKRAVEIAAQ